MQIGPGSKVYFAKKEFTKELERELGKFQKISDRLYLGAPSKEPIWFQNAWLEPKVLKIESINDAVKKLKTIQRNWSCHSIRLHRRAELIQEKLPKVKAKRIEFLGEIPTQPMGSWTLLDENTILYSAKCSSPFANGEVEFAEDKEGPPSRAYLKLWELFTVYGVKPEAGARVLDLGSSPGGWTWVLSEMGCEVTSVDKAPLDGKIAQRSNVHVLQESAFGLEPEAAGPVEWLFSDIICYPGKLLNLVEKWIKPGRRMVCTIKFQKETDFSVLQAFAEVPKSRLIHLYHNKHEVMFVL